jgi:hypothetical protein
MGKGICKLLFRPFRNLLLFRCCGGFAAVLENLGMILNALKKTAVVCGCIPHFRWVDVSSYFICGEFEVGVASFNLGRRFIGCDITFAGPCPADEGFLFS